MKWTLPGEVWIDEVQLYDLLFPLSFYEKAEQERLELIKLTHAAQSYHESGRLSDCVRLMEGYWPRFLVTHVPVIEQPVARKVEPPPPEEPERSPGFMDRMRSMVPERLRF